MTRRILERPDLMTALQAVQDATRRSHVLLVVGDCQVRYEGRSASSLGWGERILMVKADGSVLVHRPSGYEPVNWQPPGASLEPAIIDGALQIDVRRRRPPEFLRVAFRRVDTVVATPLQDHAEFDMLFTEEEVYRVLWHHPELIEPGLRLMGEQCAFAEGRPDFTAVDAVGRYVVVEVKKNVATVEAVKQLYKYVRQVRGSTGQVRGILVATEVHAAARRLAINLGLEVRLVGMGRVRELLRALKEPLTTSLDRHL